MAQARWCGALADQGELSVLQQPESSRRSVSSHRWSGQAAWCRPSESRPFDTGRRVECVSRGRQDVQALLRISRVAQARSNVANRSSSCHSPVYSGGSCAGTCGVASQARPEPLGKVKSLRADQGRPDVEARSECSGDDRQGPPRRHVREVISARDIPPSLRGSDVVPRRVTGGGEVPQKQWVGHAPVCRIGTLCLHMAMGRAHDVWRVDPADGSRGRCLTASACRRCRRAR